MIQGVKGSNCSSDEVEIEPQKRDGSKVKINALVVDKIVTTVTKDVYKVRQMIQHSINILRQDPRYRTVQTTNFQELLGGRVEMLLGPRFSFRSHQRTERRPHQIKYEDKSVR